MAMEMNSNLLSSFISRNSHPGCECPDEWIGNHCAEKAGPGLLERAEEVAFDLASAKNLFLLVVIIVFVVGICAFIVNRLGIKMPRLRRRRKTKRQMEEARKPAGLLRTNLKMKRKSQAKKQPKDSGKKGGRRVGGKRVGGRPSQRAPEPPVEEEYYEESQELNQEPMVEQNVRFSDYEQPAGLGSYSDGPDAGAGEII